MTRMWLKWMPAAVVPVLIASVAVIAPLAANAAVSLPSKSAEQILSLIANEKVTSFSGTVSQVSDLGIPSLPTPGRSAGGDGLAASVTSILSLITGTHTARIYADGETKLRVQIMDNLAERNLVRNGSDLWLYSSRDHTAVHALVPDRAAPGDTSPVPKSLVKDVQTPEQIVSTLLAAVRPTTDVTVGTAERVAGRAAYTLTMTPKTQASLVKNVSVAVDSATGMPLSVTATATGQQTPAFSVAFTAIDFTAPDASLFSFTPPAGTTVAQQALPTAKQLSEKHDTATSGQHAVRQGDGLDNPPSAPEPGVKVSGSGWATIISIPATPSTARLLESSIVGTLSTAVSGGRLFQTSLLTVLVTTDGRIIAGSVSGAFLQAAAFGK